MPASIHPEIRSEVTKQWLAGITRERIAKQNSIGTGTVSSIVCDWKQGLLDIDIEPIRELTVQIRKLGINLIECADAARLVNRIKRAGGNTRGVEKLLTSIQNKCIASGLPQEKICELLIQLFNISKSQSLPLELVPGHMERKIQNLMQEYELKRMKIDGMSLLLDVPKWDILRWNDVLEKHREVITIESLAEDVEQFGSIRKAIEKQSQKVKELRLKQTWRESEIESLKKEEERIKKSISVLEQNTLKTIERLGDAAIQAVSNKAGELEETQEITRMSESINIFDNQNKQLSDPQAVEEKLPLIPYQKDIIAEGN
jgi:DNA-binding FrmR family transcriptional regulator